MIRLVMGLLMLIALAWSLWAVFSEIEPRRLKAAGWGMLAGGLIVAGLWMIAGDL